MGKIRVKTLGVEELEKQQAEDAKKRRDVKRAKQEGVEVSELEGREEAAAQTAPEASAEVEKKPAAKKKSAAKARVRGKKYTAAKAKVDHEKTYSVGEAVKLLRDTHYANFDETVEIHLNVKESGLKGEVGLPHGTGKAVKVAIADEALLGKLENGTIEFDVLISTPAFMAKLVPFAKLLGPKGLMPNPKTGTVTDKPEEAAKKFQGGTVRYKTEAKSPLIHQSVGKLSFKDEQLVENISALIGDVKSKNITSAYVSATMTPSVRIQVEG